MTDMQCTLKEMILEQYLLSSKIHLVIIIIKTITKMIQTKYMALLSQLKFTQLKKNKSLLITLSIMLQVL